jgi:hypothetical protein
MKEVTVRLQEEDLARFDQQAAYYKVSRAEVIRRQLSGDSSLDAAGLTPKDFYNLVSVVRKRTGNNLDTRQIEAVVTAVLIELRS